MVSECVCFCNFTIPTKLLSIQLPQVMWKERVILQILDNFIHICLTSLLKWLYITAENVDPLFISGLCGLYMDIPSQKLLTY